VASQRNQVPAPPPSRSMDVTDPAVQQALGTASSMGAAAYFAAKMTPPSVKSLIFSSATSSVQNDTFKGSFNPMSVVVTNPTAFVIYLAVSGANPSASGIPIAPLSISPRLPIPAQNLVIGIDPAADIFGEQYEIWIFRFATPD
jgi:hypothetical protein